MWDRFDIYLKLPSVNHKKPTSDRKGKPNESVRARVMAAHERQSQRFEGGGLRCNADMAAAHIREFCQLDDAGKALMRTAMAQLSLNARSS